MASQIQQSSDLWDFYLMRFVGEVATLCNALAAHSRQNRASLRTASFSRQLLRTGDGASKPSQSILS